MSEMTQGFTVTIHYVERHPGDLTFDLNLKLTCLDHGTAHISKTIAFLPDGRVNTALLTCRYEHDPGRV